ncbi:MAG TPA: MFS transporter, partial [Gemmataceae bacterium]
VPRPDKAPEKKPKEADDEWHSLPPAEKRTPAWRHMLSDGQMRLLCFQQFLRAGAMVFFFTWFARYLEEAKHVSPADAGTLAAYPPFAGALGGVCGGLLSEWLLRKTGNPRIARQGMSFVALVCCTTAAGIAYFIDDARLAVVFISIGAFCGIVSGVSAYALAIAYGGKRVATVFGTMNMSGNFGATLFPYAVGLLTAEGNWDRALLLFVAMFGASAVCWIFLNPKGTLFDEESS